MCSAIGEFRSEALAPGVRHVMFVRQRRHGTLRIFFAEGFVEEDEVGVAPPHGGVGGLEGPEVGLYGNISILKGL